MTTPDNLLPVFSFRPNWANGVTESLEWMTAILDSPTGAEQRIAQRLSPRRSFEVQLDVCQQERTFFDLFVRRFRSSEFMVPLWHDHGEIAAAASIGATGLSLDTTNREFVAGGMALIVGADAMGGEAVRINGVSPSGITLLAPLNLAWPAGAAIHPLRRARFDNDPKVKHQTDNFDRGPISFLLSANNPYDGGVEDLAVAAGLPILGPTPDWSQTLDLTHARRMFTVDNKTGRPNITDEANRGFTSQQHRWFIHGRAELAAFYRLLYRLRGRQVPLWLPSFMSDLIVAGPASVGVSTIDVQACGLVYCGFPAAGRDHALTPAGQVLSLADASRPSANVERLTLAAPLTASLAAGDALQFADVGRLDSDKVEILHVTDSDGVTTATLPFKSFANARDGSAAGALEIAIAAKNADGCGCGPSAPDCSATPYTGALVVEIGIPNPAPAFTLSNSNGIRTGVLFQVFVSMSYRAAGSPESHQVQFATYLVGNPYPESRPTKDIFNNNEGDGLPPPSPTYLGAVSAPIYDYGCSRSGHLQIAGEIDGSTLRLTYTFDDPHFYFSPNFIDPGTHLGSWFDDISTDGDWIAINISGDNQDGQWAPGSFSTSASITVNGVTAPSAAQYERWTTGTSGDPSAPYPASSYGFRCVPYQSA